MNVELIVTNFAGLEILEMFLHPYKCIISHNPLDNGELKVGELVVTHKSIKWISESPREVKYRH